MLSHYEIFMTIARKHIINDQFSGVYHCIARCVRRAFLCGFDKLLGKNFDYRKDWVRDRLKFLTEIFSIEVLGYALMSNHQHLLLRSRPELSKVWDNKEVVLRWFRLYPQNNLSEVEIANMIELISGDEARVSELRKRLSSISWFMKSLNEFIARRANKEDECKGRFWEGRFKCQRLEDDQAILSCAAYIDLNPIRAKVSDSLITSEFTSIYERIMALKSNESLENLWLAPLQDTKNRKGFLKIGIEEYLKLLDLTGRQIQTGKRGSISDQVDPILVALGMDSKNWVDMVGSVSRAFSYFIGSVEKLDRVAKNLGQKWLKGRTFAVKYY